MKRLLTQIIIVAVAYVGLFQTDWTAIGLPVLPDWINILNPTPAPIPDAGLRVFIFEETADRDKLQPGQREALLADGPGSVRDYARTHCVKIGNQPEFRLIDKDQDLTRDTVAVQLAGKLPRTSLPWLIVSNGKSGQSIPLPATAAETLAILKKFGGE
jgi:hypothetical protein